MTVEGFEMLQTGSQIGNDSPELWQAHTGAYALHCLYIGHLAHRIPYFLAS